MCSTLECHEIRLSGRLSFFGFRGNCRILRLSERRGLQINPQENRLGLQGKPHHPSHRNVPIQEGPAISTLWQHRRLFPQSPQPTRYREGCRKSFGIQNRLDARQTATVVLSLHPWQRCSVGRAKILKQSMLQISMRLQNGTGHGHFAVHR